MTRMRKLPLTGHALLGDSRPDRIIAPNRVDKRQRMFWSVLTGSIRQRSIARVICKSSSIHDESKPEKTFPCLRSSKEEHLAA